MLGSYLSKRNHKGLVLGANNTTCVCVIVGAKHMVAEMNVREFSISKNDRTSNSNSKFLTLPTILTLGRVAAVPLLVASMFVIRFRFLFFFFFLSRRDAIQFVSSLFLFSNYTHVLASSRFTCYNAIFLCTDLI